MQYAIVAWQHMFQASATQRPPMTKRPMSNFAQAIETPLDAELHCSSVALRQVNEMLENQSKRIAHAVHDGAGQILAAVMIRLDQSEQESNPSCGSCFREIRRMLEQVEFQLRELSHDLRPPVLDDFGLVPALQVLADKVGRRSGLTVLLNHSIGDRLPPPVETALYRVIQEAVTNGAKHGHAKHVWIEISSSDTVHCSIRDDGNGFEMGEVIGLKGSGGLGLLGIRERVELVGGTVTISSLPGRGTELVVRIPLGV